MMYQILYKDNNGMNFVQPCMNESQKDHFVQILTNAGIDYTIIEKKAEMYYQLCGCVFKSEGHIYTFVRPEGDAKPGMSATVEVTDSYGHISMSEVVILDTRKAPVSEIKAIANRLGRNKLGKVVKIWQRKIA